MIDYKELLSEIEQDSQTRGYKPPTLYSFLEAMYLIEEIKKELPDCVEPSIHFDLDCVFIDYHSNNWDKPIDKENHRHICSAVIKNNNYVYSASGPEYYDGGYGTYSNFDDLLDVMIDYLDNEGFDINFKK